MAATYDLQAQYSLMLNLLFTQTLAQNSQPDVLVPGTPSFPSIGDTFTYGTGAVQAKNIWHDTRTVLSGANDDLVLNGGSLTNAFGTALALTKVNLFFMRVRSPVTGANLAIGHAAANVWPAWFSATTATDNVHTEF